MCDFPSRNISPAKYSLHKISSLMRPTSFYVVFANSRTWSSENRCCLGCMRVIQGGWCCPMRLLRTIKGY